MDEPKVRVKPGEMLEQIRQLFTVERVYGEPIEVMGKTIIPVAQIAASGGGGGGEGEGPADPPGRAAREIREEKEAAQGIQYGSGMGFGFGGTARPVGFMVVDGDKTTWMPVVNPEKIAIKALTVVSGLVKMILKMSGKRAGAR